MNILVVDDHPENVLALRAILSEPDYNIVEASSGAAALKQVLRHDFAVILMDVLMPEMDGFETAGMIRQREASKHVPIIFLTAAGAEVSSVYRGYSVGAVDYLVKPIDADIVRAKVAVFVDLFRKEQRIREQEERLREAERKLSEEALRSSEARYQAAFDRAPVGIAHADLTGRWMRMNQKFCEVAGSSPERLPDEALYPLIAREMDERREEKQYVHETGRTVWVSEVLSLVRDAGGSPRHFIVVLEDITERRASEQRARFLASASRLLQSSFDHRKTLAEVARLAAGTVAQGCVIELIGEDKAPEMLAFAHTDPVQERELEQRWRSIPQSSAPDTNSRLMIVPLISQRRLLGRIGFQVDRSTMVSLRSDLVMAEDLAQRAALAIENARLYREAQDAIGARDEFLSIASHELRTPLTPLHLLFQRLLGEAGRQAEQRSKEQLEEVLVRGERQVQRLTALVDKLLDVSRIAAGKLDLQREACDLVEITLEVLARQADELSRANCEVDLVAPSPVLGRWDELRIEQVITNLLSNALKYGAGCPIRIEIGERQSRAVFQIQDRGVGIEPDKLARIFDRFERAVSARSYGGLGLGLYIARQLVGAHGGSIQVESQPGAGSLFTIELPLEPAGSEVR